MCVWEEQLELENEDNRRGVNCRYQLLQSNHPLPQLPLIAHEMNANSVCYRFSA